MRAVQKLRLGIVALACVAFAIAFVAIIGLGLIQKRQENMSQGTLPVVFETHKINQTAFQIAEIVEGFEDANDESTAQELAAQLVVKNKEFTQAFDNVFALDPSLPLGPTRQAITNIRDLTEGVLRAKEEQFQARRRYENSFLQIEDAMSVLLSNTDDARTTAGLNLAYSAVDRNANTLRQAFSLHSMVESLVSGFHVVASAKTKNEISAANAMLELKIRNLVGSIVRFPNSPHKSEIASQIVVVADMLDNLDFIENMFALNEQVSKSRAMLGTLFSEVSSLQVATGDIVELQKERTIDQNIRLSETVKKISNALVLITIVCGVATAGLILVVVERQIAKRLEWIYTNTARIERGELTEPSSIEGDDEIAALGRSVDRLRVLSKHQQDIETNLRSARDAAVETATSKSNFLAMLSHEIRTPLNAIMGLFELLERADIPEKQQIRASKGRRTSEELFHLLSSVLDASRLEAGSLDIRIEAVETQDVYEFVSSFLEGAVAKSGKSLTADVFFPGDADRHIMTDRHRLRQILTNLCDNAVQFTETGRVHVVFEFPDSSDTMLVRVEDTGVGIHEADRDHVFEAFRQADMGERQRFDGSGLGLSISRKLTILMGGTLKFLPSANGGSIFVLELPCRNVWAEKNEYDQSIAC